MIVRFPFYIMNYAYKVQKFMPIHAYVKYLRANWNYTCSVIMAENIESFARRGLCLKKQIPFISEGILERSVEHKINGEVFLQLNDEYLREIAPLLGRLKLKKIINKALAESFVSHLLYYSRVISILVYVTCSLEPLIAIQPRCNLLPYTIFCLSHSMYFAT